MQDEQLREALLAAQAATAERRQGLIVDLTSVIEAASDVATDDEHDPEGATIAYERSRLTTLVAHANEQLAEIQAGLGRLAEGSYGRCEQCGNRIGEGRLAAVPATRTCRDCADLKQRR
ncbi:MAG TPA: TraR/DksA C4-type zinc finger protein [Mycobacteriales bacterium]|jgi:RNA polymerase-binding transcription factor DksA|nr:TraR/DksA C4-type zinc finger protein [Mycobacteriales bacterium]